MWQCHSPHCSAATFTRLNRRRADRDQVFDEVGSPPVAPLPTVLSRAVHLTS